MSLPLSSLIDRRGYIKEDPLPRRPTGRRSNQYANHQSSHTHASQQQQIPQPQQQQQQQAQQPQQSQKTSSSGANNKVSSGGGVSGGGNGVNGSGARRQINLNHPA